MNLLLCLYLRRVFWMLCYLNSVAHTVTRMFLQCIPLVPYLKMAGSDKAGSDKLPQNQGVILAHTKHHSEAWHCNWGNKFGWIWTSSSCRQSSDQLTCGLHADELEQACWPPRDQYFALCSRRACITISCVTWCDSSSECLWTLCAIHACTKYRYQAAS